MENILGKLSEEAS